MRSIYKFAIGIVFVGLGVVAMPRALQADAVSQETFFTFSGPVALPGVVLPAGTYIFTLAGSGNDQSIVRVLSRDGATCYGIFLTVPDDQPTNTVGLSLTQEPGRAPALESVKTWFYPDLETGHRFIYPVLQVKH